MFESLSYTELTELRTKMFSAYRLCHKLSSACIEFGDDYWNMFMDVYEDPAEIHSDIYDEINRRYSDIL